MPDVIQPATSGRAKCRGCGRSIATGELRFGESLPNPYAEGETLHWFHLVCAACMRPENLLSALRDTSEDVPERAWLEGTASLGALHRRLPRLIRAERAPSGRARCRSCREVVEKDGWRLALQIFQDGRANPIGTIHTECATAYFGTSRILDRIVRLTPDLGEGDREEIGRALDVERPARTALAAAQPETGQLGPGLAKTGERDDGAASPSVSKAGSE